MIKSKLRNKVLKLRKSNSKKSININPSNIYSYFKKKNYNLKIIGGYYPSNYEINDLEILNYFCKRGSKISLPKIKKKSQMEFYKWYKNDPLLINKYGIPEPEANNRVYPDILFVPLVAFDNELNSFVIIEYKLDKNNALTDQGYSYLNTMMNNKSKFVLEMSNKKIR